MDDLSRAKIPNDLISEVGKGAALEGDGVGSLLLADDHRGPPQPVPGGDNPVIGQDEE